MQEVTSGLSWYWMPGVQVLFVLAHNHQVHVGMPGVHERVVGDARADIGVLAQRLARGHVEALEAAALWRGDGSLQKHPGSAMTIPRRSAQSPPSFPADRPFLRFQWFRSRGRRPRLPESPAWRS